jgi:hypothetical protein
MPRILAYTVSDHSFFTGTLAAVNSFLHYNKELNADIIVANSGEYNKPLSEAQIEMLTKAGAKVMPHTDFAVEGRVLGAWQLKAYGPADLADKYDLVIGFDSDLMFCSSVADVINESLSTGLIMGGKDAMGGQEGVIYDERFTPYGIEPSPERTTYMSAACYFLPVTEVNKRILQLWSIRSDTAAYGPQKEKVYHGHGDQGILNATLYAETKHTNVKLLDNNTWTQHWTFESDVVQWDGESLWNYSSNSKMRTLHCGGCSKFWTKECSEKRETVGGSQRWIYAHFLRMVFLAGPAWDKDPATVIPDNQHHLLADFINYHQLIRVMEPDFRQLYEEKLHWHWLHRLCTSVDQHRSMVLNGASSMDRYIELVKTLPDRSLIVEMGSYVGGSIVTLAAALLARGHTLWSAESFTGNLDNTVDGFPLPTLKKYVQNTKSNLPFLNINIAQLPGHFAASMFEDESIDFMFIDGDHSTEAVLRDIEMWLPKVKKGGILAGDDIGWASVKQAVEQKFGSDYVEKQSVWHTIKPHTL